MKNRLSTGRFVVLSAYVIAVAYFSGLAQAGNPAPLFDRPVKLDASGRPLYNSWQRQEEHRKKRRSARSEENSPTPTVESVKPSQDGQVTTSEAVRAAGTSAVTNGQGYLPVKSGQNTR